MTKEEINKELNTNGVDGLVFAIQNETNSIHSNWFLFWLFTCIIFGGAILTNSTLQKNIEQTNSKIIPP